MHKFTTTHTTPHRTPHHITPHLHNNNNLYHITLHPSHYGLTTFTMTTIVILATATTIAVATAARITTATATITPKLKVINNTYKRRKVFRFLKNFDSYVVEKEFLKSRIWF